jgi:hypothetical protein
MRNLPARVLVRRKAVELLDGDDRPVVIAAVTDLAQLLRLNYS